MSGVGNIRAGNNSGDFIRGQEIRAGNIKVYSTMGCIIRDCNIMVDITRC